MHTALITGVSRGIGKALAQKFLDNNYFVIGTSTSGECDFRHDNLVVFQLDLASETSIENCVADITKLNKKVDVLVNNAGIVVEGDALPTIKPETLRQTMEVNLIGPINFTQKILRLINSGGHILNMSSRMGSMGYASHPRDPSYRMSKAAVNMFTRVLALHLENKIAVSSINPGWVKTDMGGMDADMEPKEAVGFIYDLAVSRPETGQFWFKGEKFPW